MMHVKTLAPIVFHVSPHTGSMNHSVSMSYFPALTRINGPEKQQFYHIYSLEQHTVTSLRLLSAPSICCVLLASVELYQMPLYIALKALYEEKGQTMFHTHSQPKCITRLDILSFRCDVIKPDKVTFTHARGMLRT